MYVYTHTYVGVYIYIRTVFVYIDFHVYIMWCLFSVFGREVSLDARITSMGLSDGEELVWACSESLTQRGSAWRVPTNFSLEGSTPQACMHF